MFTQGHTRVIILGGFSEYDNFKLAFLFNLSVLYSNIFSESVCFINKPFSFPILYFKNGMAYKCLDIFSDFFAKTVGTN